ncbi:MAG: glycosyltransferase [Candidatus Nanohaloarchaeota archaeon QJJ-7]|nr:glycosyltransferase [Candidatus Nanohaloarchaeota archaeon QJJ-7]
MSLSVVIPVYNEPYVFTAIDELMEQKEEGDEIIAVNDSSSSEEFTEDFENFCDGEEVIAISGESSGAAENRIKGVEEASNEKIAFLDADCRPGEGWMRRMDEALEDSDLVEGAVVYGSEERCPLDRIIENRDEENRFLTANLGVRKEVFEEVGFDDRYRVHREDTDFGFQALEAGFASTFEGDAEVFHMEGRYSPVGFLKDRLRYVSEPLFFSRFRGTPRFEEEVKHIGKLLYPKEFAALFLFAALAFLPFNYLTVPLLAFTLASRYQLMKMQEQDCGFCPKDFLLMLLLVPLALVAKRYAIWKGALRYRVPVI